MYQLILSPIVVWNRRSSDYNETMSPNLSTTEEDTKT